jgi:murein DD-endopeptidase MepM/ murein hydrolase activator NlpD
MLYDNDPYPEWDDLEPGGGSLAGFAFIPFVVLAVGIALALALSRVTGTTGSTSIAATGSGGADPLVFVSPYDDYVLTQGLHGFSYGHMAIDIAAGEGADIHAPINGIVAARFTDGLGNPVLILENEVYRVTLMHGIYTVQQGETVSVGQVIGSESNLGNTTDMQGNSCRNRDCGYHTHLNVYDKRISANVNPLDLLNP